VERIQKYEIAEEIGQGGMSIVYRGRDPVLQRDVAVKVLHRHLSRDPEARERFAREARAVARLTHHNIPEIYDFSSEQEEQNFLVTELVDGQPLSKLIQDRKIELPEVAVMVALGVADALGHAHAHRVIHRDVKPENILVGRDGVTKLTDFGIAHIVGLESMTMTGTLVGSPAHMSPEQIDGTASLDFRSDVWAMGTVLYVATTGRLPFNAGTPHGVLKRIMDGKYEDPRRLNPHVDAELTRIIGRCLQVDKTARYLSMELLGQDLETWLSRQGLDDLETELEAFMRDPAAYQAELRQRLVAGLLTLAQQNLTATRRHLALEAYGRVLTLDPKNQLAADRLAEIGSGRRARRALGVGLGGVALVGIVAWVLAELRPWEEAVAPPEPTPVPVTAEALPPLDVEPLRLAAIQAVASSGLPARPILHGSGSGQAVGEWARGWQASLRAEETELARRAAMAHLAAIKRPKLEPAKLEVRLTVNPVHARLSIDGRSIEAGTVGLAPGKHEAVLKLEACADCLTDRYAFKVDPGTDHLHFDFRFPRQPFVVEVACPGGRVTIRGPRLKTEVACGGSFQVPVFMKEPGVVPGTFTALLASGKEVTKLFNVSPGGHARWRLDL
jgi:serine/threonine-protein kinase